MLQVNKRFVETAAKVAPDSQSLADLYIAAVSFVRRQFPIIVPVWLCIFALGFAYLLTAPARYTAKAELLIDSRKMQLFAQQSVLGDISVDSATVESQVEVLKSENVALVVIRKLHLDSDPQFVSQGGGIVSGIIGRVRSLFTRGGQPDSEFAKLRRTVAIFESNLKVKRVGLTYVIDISFRSLSPDRAAQIANEVADAYVVDQLDAKDQATRLAGKWLHARIQELRDQASNAERAVLDFKQKHNIVDTGGRLMGEQQLVEINSQLVTAQSQTAEAQARVQRVRTIIDKGTPQGSIPGILEQSDPAVTDSLHDEVIVKLRNQYLEYAAREADLSRRLGPNHLAVVNLRNQMLEARKAIFDELNRIAQAYQSDYQIAKAREDSIRKTLSEVVAHSQSTDQAQVSLRQLESTAQTYRALYDSFLQRYMEATQQESFPITEARVISRATRPMSKSQPNTLLVLALASVGGMLIAFGGGLWREIGDRAFRSGSQVKATLYTDCVAVVPLVKSANTRSIGRARRAAAEARMDPRLRGTRFLINDQSMLWYAVNQPFSQFAESVRAVKLAADGCAAEKANKVIGVTSSVPNEGKSTIAASLAQLIAHGGARVALVDADLRNPILSHQLAPNAKAGLIEILSDKVPLSDVLWTDATRRLAFLPTVLKTRLAYSSEFLASTATKTLFGALAQYYDYVIADLSPLTPVVDVRATTSFVHSYVYVIEWGRTNAAIVEHALDAARSIHDNLLGVVLNKADFDVLNRYGDYRGSYYRRYYAHYGRAA
jgi:polysaccharide biosynthesis transport protein